MHHIAHIRKRGYTLIPQTCAWEQVMHLRGRKQIPVCAACHRELIHKGIYNDLPLRLLSPRIVKMYDLRTVQLENFVRPGNPHYAQNLLEKGWKLLHH